MKPTYQTAAALINSWLLLAEQYRTAYQEHDVKRRELESQAPRDPAGFLSAAEHNRINDELRPWANAASTLYNELKAAEWRVLAALAAMGAAELDPELRRKLLGTAGKWERSTPQALEHE